MASFLESQLKAAIYKGFKGKLLTGSLSRKVPGGGLDSFGDPITPTTETFPCEGFTETFSAFYRNQAGIPDTDVSLMIIAGSITTVPKKDDSVTFRGVTYRVRKVLDIDPGGATYRLQAYEQRS